MGAKILEEMEPNQKKKKKKTKYSKKQNLAPLRPPLVSKKKHEKNTNTLIHIHIYIYKIYFVEHEIQCIHVRMAK